MEKGIHDFTAAQGLDQPTAFNNIHLEADASSCKGTCSHRAVTQCGCLRSWLVKETPSNGLYETLLCSWTEILHIRRVKLQTKLFLVSLSIE